MRRYAREVLRWRARLNLTGASSIDELVDPHLLDVLLLVAVVEIPRPAEVIDIGTGAGLPGIPMYILRPDLRVTLVEASRKKVAFLEYLQTSLDMADIRIECGRAEILGHRQNLREQFDISVTQATARLAAAVELCVPFVRPGGAAVFPKGPHIADELSRARGLIAALGAGIEASRSHSLPASGGRRTILVLRKNTTTPPIYPRSGAALGRPPREHKGTNGSSDE